MFKFRVTTRASLLFVLMALFVLSNATATEVNNCCSVDRQCVTDNEWVAGYYAFQNNQCGLPSQQQQSTPAPARQRSGASAGINNCCFSGWQCDADDDWTSGYFAFQHDHCFSQSHWEEQMRKRQSGNQQAQAKEDSSRPQAKEQNSEGPPSENRNSATDGEKRRTVSVTFRLSNPEDTNHKLQDGNDVYVRPRPPVTCKEILEAYPEYPLC